MESGRLFLPFLPEDHIKRDNETSSKTYNPDDWDIKVTPPTTYDPDNWDLEPSRSRGTYDPDNWDFEGTQKAAAAVEELEEEESGFIEYINQGTIDFEDIKRVRKREINIYGYDR